MTGERLQILQMVQEGKLTAEEALKLLEAVEAPQPKSTAPAPTTLRVRVTDRTGRTKNAEIRIPLKLASAIGRFLNFTAVAETERVTWDQVEQAVAAGQSGRIIDIAEGDRRVEVFVE